MKTSSTSRAFGLLLVLLSLLFSLPAAAQPVPDPDEESTVVRTADPDEEASVVRTADDDEESTVVRTGDDDEESSVVRTGNDDEESSVVRKEPEETLLLAEPEPAASPWSAGGMGTGRIQGYFFEKWAFDTAHDGNGEDVFDIRTKIGLSGEINTPSLAKLYLSARFSHFVVGEESADESWHLFNSDNVKWDYEAELQEAYLYLPNDIVNVRVGNQIVRWGYGQFNKPSDVLNPTDFREGLFSDLEVPLLPVFMLHLDRNLGPVNVSGVWLPFFTPNRANLFGQDWAPLSAMYGNPAFASVGGMSQMYGMMGGLIGPALEEDVQPLMLATQPPEENLENGQFGARFATRFLGIDASLIYFYGWDKLPFVEVNQEFLGDVGIVTGVMQQYPAVLEVLKGMTALDPFDPLTTGAGMLAGINGLSDEEKAAMQQAMQAVGRILFDEEGNPRQLSLNSIFATRYRRQHTVGLSLSTVLFDTIGVKADSAFSPARTLFLESPSGFPIPRSLPALSYSLGLDYRKGSWFDIMAEFYHFHVFDLDPGEEVFVIGSDLYMVTVASHLRFLDFDALEFQVAGMMELNTQSLFFFPKVSYKFTDTARLGVGGILVEVVGDGDEMGPGGLFDRNDSVYAEFKLSF